MTFSNLPNNPPQQTTNIVSGAYTTVGAGILNGDLSVMALEVAIAGGGGNMSSFKVQVQLYPGGNFYDYIVDSDFASTTQYAIIRTSSTSPHAVTAGNGAWSLFRMEGIYAFQFLAKGSSSASVTVNWFGRKQRGNYGHGST